MKSIRIGIVGASFAARYHVECLRRVYAVGVEIIGVTSPREDSREAFGQAHVIPVCEGLAALVERADSIDLCSPPVVHEEAILAAAASGKGIICEKPLSGTFGSDATATSGSSGTTTTTSRIMALCM